MTRKQTPPLTPGWAVIDTHGAPIVQLCYFAKNARFVADKLNEAEPGRYEVRLIDKLGVEA